MNLFALLQSSKAPACQCNSRLPSWLVGDGCNGIDNYNQTRRIVKAQRGGKETTMKVTILCVCCESGWKKEVPNMNENTTVGSTHEVTVDTLP